MWLCIPGCDLSSSFLPSSVLYVFTAGLLVFFRLFLRNETEMRVLIEVEL